MQTKIAILRGINVGGHRKILMADLRQILETSGLKNIVTYIQSGNVVFKSDLENSALEILIENAIQTHFGFNVPAIVRTHQELSNLIKNNPFYANNVDVKKLHVTFLKPTLEKENINTLDFNVFKPDVFSVSDKAIYLYLENAYHKSKLSTNFFEKTLNVGATTRNWKTTLKLLELCEKLH